MGNPADRPDRLHFHQMAMRFFSKLSFFGRRRRNIVNPIATIVLMPLISAPQLFGILYWNNLEATVLLTCFMTLIFLWAHISWAYALLEHFVCRNEKIFVMKIVVVGLGYVGLSNAVLLAHYNEVVCVDIAKDRVDALNSRTSPIIDAELSEYLNERIEFKSAVLILKAHYVGLTTL